eukprot:gene21116-25354_t
MAVVVQRYLGPAMDVFPNDPYAPGCYFPERKLDELSLWDFVRSSIQLSPRHPEHLVRLLNQASKNELCVADIEDRKLQADAAESLCQGVEREVVARTTVIGGLLVDWMQLSFHQIKIELTLKGGAKEDFHRVRRVSSIIHQLSRIGSDHLEDDEDRDIEELLEGYG